MSWAKVKKINSNMSKSLDTLITEVKNALTTSIQAVTTNVNTQTQSVTTNVNTKVQSINNRLNDLKYQPIRIITATGTFTPEKTGKYKVICVGAGGKGDTFKSTSSSTSVKVASGGGGGVAIKTLRLLSTTSYNVTVGTTASFTHESGSLSATAGSGGDASDSEGGTGGTASGGDFNYSGTNGSSHSVSVSSNKKVSPTPGSVGVFISDLSRSGESELMVILSEVCKLRYGDSILGYGGSGNAVGNATSSAAEHTSAVGLPAAVIIVPIEMEG